MKSKTSTPFAISLILWAATSLTTQAQPLWTVGLDDNGWPCSVATPCAGGGATATYVQENGNLNALPGNPASPKIDQQGDNDYYFAGNYANTIASVIALYGAYVPVGVVTTNEESVERAFSGGGDIDLRYHFNLADTLQPTDLLSVTFDALNLDTGGNADPRYGIEVYFNGVKVQDEIVIRPAQTGKAFTTPQFSLASVNAQVGSGFDNIVSLKGVYYGGDGGGNWMGFDYVQLNPPAPPIPAPVFPWAVGLDDNAFPLGDGGGPNASFVQESGTSNPLPGSPTSPEIDRQADDDYYFAGSYTTAIAANGAYTPVGLVPFNEEAAERAFTGGDNDLRYHFNLPNNLSPNQLVSVKFDALSLDDSAGLADPRYGVEVYFNGVRIQTERIIRPAQLNQTITTLPVTLGSVNAAVGSGFDNIVTLRGINYSAEGGGAWMGIDYVQLNPATNAIPPPVLPWSVGLDDNAWPPGGVGGGTNANFESSDGVINSLPGNPTSTEANFDWDDDYYFAGAYTTVIAGNGVYTPVGGVFVNEETAKGGFYLSNNDLRYHFNLPGTLGSNDLLTVTFDALDLIGGTDPRYGVEVYFNNVLVQTQIVIRPAQVGVANTTPPFTLASVNAQVGPGFDNILTLRGINYSAQGGSDSMGLDYVQLSPKSRATFPWAVGLNDNRHIVGNGGGPNTTFVQENGVINPLPGRSDNPEVNQQSDNDYYFAGEYTTALPGVINIYGAYTPIGVVLANEEGAERAFAAADNDLRYHFNLPGTLQPDDLLAVTFDTESVDDSVTTDRRYGVEVYFNGVLVQTQLVIRPAQVGVVITTPPFTLATVDARVGVGFDNIVSLKGINYSAEGGGNWMGIDFVQLNPVKPSTFPWAVGKDDNTHITTGTGGGPNANFVQENGALNPLPGSAFSLEVNQQSDNDYYFAGSYTNIIAGNGTYTPVGLVPVNEGGAERAFCCDASPTADNVQRYHFNLPGTLLPTDLLAVTFDALDLDGTATDPRYGVEVYFNGVLVQPQILIRPADTGVANTSPAFTLASVDGKVGPGFDNIVTLKGINYSAEGGGAWMGIDYVQLNIAPLVLLPPVVNNGQVTINWTVPAQLEWAPTVLGPWTPVTPAPTPPYSEAVVAGANRFYRLSKP